MNKASKLSSNIYYGWVVIGTLFTVTLMSSGTRFSFGAFYDALLDDFGWSRSLLAGAASLNLILAGLVRPILGTFVDRFGSKEVLAAGLALAAISLVLLSFATSLWHFYLLFSLMSVGYAAASPATAVPLVSRWFVRQRATAQSIASTGSPTGELLVVPILTAVLLLTDWQTAYRILAVGIGLLLLPCALVLVRNDPSELGLMPDNDGIQEVASKSQVDLPGMSLNEALRSPLFWQLGFGFFVCGFTMTFASTHFMVFAGDLGIKKMTVSFAMAMIGGVSIVATVLFGYFGDRLPRKNLLAAVYFLRGAAFFVLWTTHEEYALFLGAFLLGLSWGATTPLTSACVSDAYGQRNLGSIFGTMFAIMPIGAGLGAYLAAAIFDVSGSYGPALLLDGILGCLAALTIYRIKTSDLASYRLDFPEVRILEASTVKEAVIEQ